MILLALETSAKAASCAIARDGVLTAEFFTNAGLKHSETIMPMVRSALDCARIALSDVDAFAVSAGPGSFTGLRIGIAAIKGMAMPLGKPCVAVSPLEALAYNASIFSGVAAPMMDARRGEVYTALFKTGGGEIERVNRDAAISAEKLCEELLELHGPFMITGDGAPIHYEAMARKIPGLLLAPEDMLHQSARGVIRAAAKKLEGGCNEHDTADTLSPVYLRLSQAERERNEKNQT